MKRVKYLVLAAVAVLLAPCTGLAFDLEQVRINGFVSQGYMESSDNNFLADTKGGTTQFNEVGLAVTSQVTDKLRIGAQILSRDLGEVGNNEVKLDWGFADYHHNDYHGLRVGKVKLPMGLYNEGRDSDFLRPMVFLPQSIYDETKRDLLVAYQGGGLYGNIPLGLLGDIDYHGFYGSINIPDDALLPKALQQNATFTLRSNLGPVLVPAHRPEFVAYHAARLGLAPGDPSVQAAATADAQQFVQGINVTKLEVNNDHIGGGSLVFNTGVDGLRLGFSYLEVSNEIDLVLNKSVDTTIDPLNPSEVFVPTKLKGTLDNKSTIVGSLEYTIGDLVLAGEYSETDREQIFHGYDAMDATSQSWYAMASYTLFDKLTLSALYDVYYSDKDDKDGEDFEATNPAQRKDFFTWRKDIGVGVRYDVNANWTVKAEYHDVDGAGLFMTVVNDPADLKEDWEYFAVKASYNF